MAIINTVDEIKRARTNRSNCFSCRKKIPIGSHIGVCITNIQKNWKRFLCKDCAREKIQSDILRCKIEISNLKKMEKDLL